MSRRTATAHNTKTATRTAKDTAPRTPSRAHIRPAAPRRTYPLNVADRKLLDALPFIENAGDLDAIPAERRRRALDFLARLAVDGTKTRDALEKSKLICWELSWMRTNSETFRRAHETILDARKVVIVERTIETLAELANGEFVPKPGCLPPEVRAASLLLPALDERFRGDPAAAQQVQINISI